MTSTHEREHHDLVVELLSLDPLSAEAVAKRNAIASMEQRDPTLIKQRLEIMAAYVRSIGAVTVTTATAQIIEPEDQEDKSQGEYDGQ